MDAGARCSRIALCARLWAAAGIVNAFIDRPQHAQFILFISFALIITGLHLVLFGPDSRPIQTIESMQSYTIGPVRLDVVRTQAALMALLLIVALMLFLKFSTLGRAIRAAADNLIGAQVIGIRCAMSMR